MFDIFTKTPDMSVKYILINLLIYITYFTINYVIIVQDNVQIINIYSIESNIYIKIYLTEYALYRPDYAPPCF